MNKTDIYDLICIGNYTKDTIVSPAGTQFVDGGAVNYAAHAAAHLGLKTAVVSHMATQDKRVVDKFKEAGIDCFVTYTPQSTCMRLEYPSTNPDLRQLSVTSTAGAISAEEITGLMAQAAVIGTSLRGEVGQDVFRTLREKDMLLAADMQGFVRVLQDQALVHAPWNEMEATLAYVNILKSDAVEAAFLTGETDIHKAAHIFHQMGVGEIVLTHKDGLLVYADGEFNEAGFYPAKLNGRSGRGDTCLGAYVAMRLSKPPAEATIWAAAVTSLKMENLRPFDRSFSDVEALISDRYHRS
ncbi:MAG: hypothetical protein E4G99_01790 [Anaerolineales bacterium]|nr:MAG: hypothetical protein E4G99_01790 [Anaerolineales bacterium]